MRFVKQTGSKEKMMTSKICEFSKFKCYVSKNFKLETGNIGVLPINI